MLPEYCHRQIFSKMYLIEGEIYGKVDCIIKRVVKIIAEFMKELFMLNSILRYAYEKTANS